jgi:hypothetical protein
MSTMNKLYFYLSLAVIPALTCLGIAVVKWLDDAYFFDSDRQTIIAQFSCIAFALISNVAIAFVKEPSPGRQKQHAVVYFLGHFGMTLGVLLVTGFVYVVYMIMHMGKIGG